MRPVSGQLGAQLEGGGGQLYAEGSAELAELQQLVYDVPDPNYSNLRRLLRMPLSDPQEHTHSKRRFKRRHDPHSSNEGQHARHHK